MRAYLDIVGFEIVESGRQKLCKCGTYGDIDDIHYIGLTCHESLIVIESNECNIGTYMLG